MLLHGLKDFISFFFCKNWLLWLFSSFSLNTLNLLWICSKSFSLLMRSSSLWALSLSSIAIRSWSCFLIKFWSNFLILLFAFRLFFKWTLFISLTIFFWRITASLYLYFLTRALILYCIFKICGVIRPNLIYYLRLFSYSSTSYWCYSASLCNIS